jgi:hypothetical protein
VVHHVVAHIPQAVGRDGRQEGDAPQPFVERAVRRQALVAGVMADRATKIVATLGPASATRNCWSDDPRGCECGAAELQPRQGAGPHRPRALVREAAQRAGREVAIMADLQGPKIRVGKFAEGKVMLEPGMKFVLDASRTEPGDINGVGLDYKELPRDVKAGDTAAAQRRPDRADGGRRARRSRCTPPSSWAASCPTTRASTSRAVA